MGTRSIAAWSVPLGAALLGWAVAGPGSGPVGDAAEVARIRFHLLGAQHLAAAQDVSALPPAARAHRARALGALRDYRARGVFPRNRDFPGRRVPYFVDAEGRRCAMAHLIEGTGDSALVARIARTRNHAYVRELADEPELTAWLERNGLSLEEAARIQPEYEDIRYDTNSELKVLILSPTLALETTGILLNVRRAPTVESRRWRGMFGTFVGFVGTVVGGSLLAADPENLSPAWGYSCVALGATCFVLGTKQVSPPRESKSQGAVVAPMP